MNLTRCGESESHFLISSNTLVILSFILGIFYMYNPRNNDNIHLYKSVIRQNASFTQTLTPVKVDNCMCYKTWGA